MKYFITYPAELILLLFLSITFLQSSLDKLLDWKGNLSWLKAHFSKTFIRNSVPFALFIILVLELLSGLLVVIGFFDLAFYGSPLIGLAGATVSCTTLLVLLFGQRIAKDYLGAQTIIIYLMPAVFTVFLLA